MRSRPFPRRLKAKFPRYPKAAALSMRTSPQPAPPRADRTRRRTRSPSGARETMPGPPRTPPFPPHVTGGAERAAPFKGQRGARPPQLRVWERRGTRR
ncbi:hypothetical protein EK904_006448 [Melospiza melodia maxima]|nr:hypothetical protein EK904_006448 [Melospiza melodia maxima]